MYLNILKKDLKRKKTMNIILLLFIVIATMFVASGMNNVITVIIGTDYYFDKAGIGDFVIITMGDEALGTTERALSDKPYVLSLKAEKVVFGSKDNIFRTDGEQVNAKNASLFQSIGNTKLNYFDSNNEKIVAITQGETYISGNFLKNNGLEVGDTIQIRHGDVKIDLKIAGKAKDALLGTDFMGNTRFLLNDADMDKLLADENIRAHYQGEITYIDSTDTSQLTSDCVDIPGIAFSGPRDMVKMCYVMEMIVAFVILILSICLIVVSFAVLKFSISFTVAEEYREIGVMKAIGIRSMKIKSLYTVKYLILAVIGAAAGLFASVPFGKLLLKSVTDNMVLGNDYGMVINVLSAAVVIAVIIFFVYICTGKVRKLSPLDAIRFGKTGERYRRKSLYRLEKSHARPSVYMAVNDVISNPKRFLTVIVSFFICTLFVLMLVNTTETMNSPKLISLFTKESDLYLSDTGSSMTFLVSGSKQDIQDNLDEKAEQLSELGMPAKLSIGIWYKYKVTFGGEVYSLTCRQGIGMKASDYEYFEGTAPQSRNEIAVTPKIAETLGAKIGDTVTIDFGDEQLDCIITAYFHGMEQRGNLIELDEDAPTQMKYSSSTQSYQIDFTDNPSEEEIELRKERIKELYDNVEVKNATEYCVDSISVVDIMIAVQYLLLGITLIVVVMVTVLVERSFIADERSQIAILKAIGFRTSDIVMWHICRFGLASLIATILAAVLSIPMTELCISPIFGMMGTNEISYNIDILKIFIVYPAVIFAVTVLTTWLTSLYTKTVKSSEASDVE